MDIKSFLSRTSINKNGMWITRRFLSYLFWVSFQSDARAIFSKGDDKDLVLVNPKERENVLAEVIPSVSVILPAYNESENVGKILSAISTSLTNVDLPYEIVFVDDGSLDNTREMASKVLLGSHVKIVGYPHNMGKGYALKYGAMFARGKYVVFMDSDLDINPSEIGKYLRLTQEGDILIASKRHPESHVVQPVMRRALSLGFHILVKFLTGVPVSDTQAGLKVFRTESLKKMLPLLSVKRYAFDVEVLTVAHLIGMRIVELPVNIHMNARFKLKNSVVMVIDLLGIAYRLRIRRWYQKNLNNHHAEYKSLINL